MQIEINKFGRTKLAEIWLTNAEQTKTSLAEARKKAAEFAAQKYKVAILMSGQKDLTTYTEALLKQNLR